MLIKTKDETISSLTFGVGILKRIQSMLCANLSLWMKQSSSHVLHLASIGKVMARVFCDAKGILLIDYLGKGQKNNCWTSTLFIEFCFLWFSSIAKSKKNLSRKCFGSNEEVVAAVNGYLADRSESHLRDGSHLLKKRWKKCIKI